MCLLFTGLPSEVHLIAALKYIVNIQIYYGENHKKHGEAPQKMIFTWKTPEEIWRSISVRCQFSSGQLHLKKKIWTEEEKKVPYCRLRDISEKTEMERKEIQRTGWQILRKMPKRFGGVKKPSCRWRRHVEDAVCAAKKLAGLIEIECMRNPTTFCLAYDFFHTVWKLS